MSKKTKYKIVVSQSIRGLQNDVNFQVDRGWKPKGSHKQILVDETYTYSGDKLRAVVRKYEFSQTMIMKE